MYKYHRPLLQGRQYGSHPSSTGCPGAGRCPHAVHSCIDFLCQLTQALRQLSDLVEPCVQASEQGAVSHRVPATIAVFPRLQLQLQPAADS